MKFKDWLLSEETKIRFTMFSSDGKVRVVIGDKKYQYLTDPLYIHRIQNVSKYKPFAALNILKDLVKNNRAEYSRIQ